MISSLRDIGGRSNFVRLGLLTLIVAASEGLGFVLLVPLLGALGGKAPDLPGGLALPALSLPALLGVFVLLVTIRALAEIHRRLAPHA